MEGWKVGRLEDWKVGRVGWKYGRVERRLEGEKAGRFSGFCHFLCLQTLLEKIGWLKVRMQFDRGNHCKSV